MYILSPITDQSGFCNQQQEILQFCTIGNSGGLRKNVEFSLPKLTVSVFYSVFKLAEPPVVKKFGILYGN